MSHARDIEAALARLTAHQQVTLAHGQPRRRDGDDPFRVPIELALDLAGSSASG